MPVECYRLIRYRELPDGRVQAITSTLAPDNTNLEALLRMVAPGVQRATGTIGDLPGNNSARYLMAPDERDGALALLESHRAPVVTAMGAGCDISVCLDFHQYPRRGVPPEEWERTETGGLFYRAKYDDSLRAVGPELRSRVVSYVEGHPLLRELTSVAAVPTSRKGGASPLLRGIAKGVSQALGVPVSDLQRVVTISEQQKNLATDDDRDANQRDTMRATITGDAGLVLLVDDLMSHGSTLREASRALRASGAAAVGSVALVKSIKGTRRYSFD